MNTKGFLNVVIAGSAAIVLAFAVSAQADSLTIGGTLTAPYSASYVISNALSPGALLATVTGTITTATYTATVREAVFNPGGGNLDYYFQVSNGAGSTDAIGRVTDRSFDLFTTDVFARTDATSTNALCGACGFLSSSLTPLSIDRQLSGLTTGWNFVSSTVLPTLTPGSTSEILIVRVNSTQFTGTGAFNSIDGSVGSVASFAPVPNVPISAVPEPASILLLGSGFLAFGAYRARRRAAQKR